MLISRVLIFFSPFVKKKYLIQDWWLFLLIYLRQIYNFTLSFKQLSINPILDEKRISRFLSNKNVLSLITLILLVYFLILQWFIGIMHCIIVHIILFSWNFCIHHIIFFIILIFNNLWLILCIIDNWPFSMSNKDDLIVFAWVFMIWMKIRKDEQFFIQFSLLCIILF